MWLAAILNFYVEASCSYLCAETLFTCSLVIAISVSDHLDQSLTLVLVFGAFEGNI